MELPDPQGHAPDVSETAYEATPRSGRRSDGPIGQLIKSLSSIGVLAVGVGGAAMVWGPLPGRVTKNEARLTAIEKVLPFVARKAAFTACRMADSTINQCVHIYTDP